MAQIRYTLVTIASERPDMTTPRNHHIVSKVVIKNFVDLDNTLYYYSKTDNSIHEKPLDRFDFAEYDLNTTINELGEIDYFTVEQTLNRHFETDFKNHYDKVIKAIKTNNLSGLTSSMKYILRMGIIGDMRTRENQIEAEEAILGSFREINEYAVDELKNSFLAFEKSLSRVKNKIGTNFKEVADRVSELMGKKIYSIFLAPAASCFFLPDCTSIALRAQLEDDTIYNGELLLNNSRPIATVIFPIDSHTVVVVQSAKICPQRTNGIYELSSESVESYNKMFLEKARNKIICIDKNYLKKFIGRHVDRT